MPIFQTQNAAHAIVALMTAVALTSCSAIIFDCGGPEYRSTVGYAPVSDSAQTIALEGSVALSEARGSNAQDARTLTMAVQSVRRATATTVPPSLVGHLVRLRLESADGTMLFTGTAKQPSFGNSVVLGSAQSSAIDAKRYDSIREQLLAGRLYIAMEMDAGVPALLRSAVRVETSTDWGQHCR